MTEKGETSRKTKKWDSKNRNVSSVGGGGGRTTNKQTTTKK